MANTVLEKSFNNVDQNDMQPGYAAPQGGGSGEGPISIPGTSDAMSVTGSARAALVLFGLVVVSGTWAWIQLPNYSVGTQWIIIFAAMIVAFILAMVTIFKPINGKITAPFYALAEGVFLGGISRIYEDAYDGIVVQAVLATSAIVFVMYTLYSTRILKVTPRFQKVVIGATLGIAVFYGMSLLLSLFGAQMPFIWDASPMGIAFSVFIIIIAASNLALDFDFIEKGSQAGLPKYMNWTAALGLVVTIVWIYLEVLRLLAKMRQ
jgi:uncharacterized YccA/Bax inhibitor family protein